MGVGEKHLIDIAPESEDPRLFWFFRHGHDTSANISPQCLSTILASRCPSGSIPQFLAQHSFLFQGTGW
jgi:hypothetical protein